MKNTSNAVKGFTLIEMMMVLAIAAILLTIAVPSYNAFSKNSKITKQTNLLVASISMARGEAAKRGARVMMCQSPDPSNTGTYCTGTSGTWSDGWVVFVDADGGSDYDSGELVISVFNSASPIEIKTNAGSYLSFNPDGTTTAGSEKEFAICDDRGTSKGKKISVAATGRPSSDDATTCSPT